MSEVKTAQVELAYPMTIGGRDYQPDDVVDLPYETDPSGGATALQLVRDGRARWHGDDPRPKPASGPQDLGPKNTTRSRRPASASTTQEG